VVSEYPGRAAAAGVNAASALKRRVVLSVKVSSERPVVGQDHYRQGVSKKADRRLVWIADRRVLETRFGVGPRKGISSWRSS
jgi:hypothetical protein